MAAVKVTPPNDFPLGLIRSHMVVIHLFLMLCDLQRVVRDLCPTLYNKQLRRCILTLYSTCSRTQIHTRTHNRCASSHFKWSVIRTMNVRTHFPDHALLPGDVAILQLRLSFSYQPLTAQAWILSQSSPCGIYVGQSFTATYFSPSTSFFQSVSLHHCSTPICTSTTSAI